MKRIGTFLAMAALATALVSAQEFERNQMKAYKVDDASSLVIDGVDNEAFWAAPEVEWQEVKTSIFDVAPAGPSDYSLSFKAVYDADFLYLFFRVKDDVIWTWAEHSGDFYNADNIELFFNPSGIHPSVEAPDWDANRDSQLRINIGSDNMATGGGFAATMAVDNEISGFEYTHKVTDGGYDVEVVLPWAAVMPEEYLDMVAEGEIIGFDVNGADADDEAGRTKGLSWSADWTDNWRWSAKFGDMTFMGLITPTSVEESTKEEISYTLVNGQLALNNLGENAIVRVCTTLGQVVTDFVASDNAYIDLTSFESNIFVVQVIDGTDSISFKVSK
ncbi:MAG: sugar-binding protein [Bacteroidales bacterium]|nr:sugar-binding protein [Bacteroidales bacterium]